MTSDSVGPAKSGQIRGSSMLLSGRVLAMGINTLTQVLIVRALTKDDYGAFAYGLSLLTFARVAVGLGHNQATTRFLARYDERGDHRHLRGTLWMLPLVALGITAVVVTVALLLRDSLLLDLLHEPRTVSVVIILLLLAPIEVIDDVLESAFAVLSRPRSIFLRKYVIGPALALGVALAVVFGGFDVHALAVGYVAAGTLGMAFYAASLPAMLRRALPASAWSGRAVLPFREFYAFSIPLLTSEALHIILVTLAVVLVGAFGSTADVAELRAIRPVALLNQVAYSTFALLFAPLVSRLHERGDTKTIGDVYWSVAAWLAVISFPVFAMTGPFAGALTELLFGSRYASSAPYLALLAIGYYANSALGFNALVLRVTGHVGLTVAISGLVAIASAALLFALVPPFGAMGASVAILVSLMLLNGANHFWMARRTAVPLVPQGLGRVYLALGLAAVLLWAVGRAFGPPAWLCIVLTAVVSAVLFVGNRTALDVGGMFPELRSIPLVGRLLTAAAPVDEGAR